MREILFRGKGDIRFNSGGWIYGVPIKDFEGDWQLCTDCTKTTVLPETIGQYIGLTDKNGAKIFEGDIVKTDKFSEPNKQYIIEYDLQFGAFIGCDRNNLYFVTFDGDSDEFEVIGNIYDNPELLKGVKNFEL